MKVGGDGRSVKRSFADQPVAQLVGNLGKEQKCLLSFPSHLKSVLWNISLFCRGCISAPGPLSCLPWLAKRHIEFQFPFRVVFRKAWQQISKALGKPDPKAESLFMSSSFKCSSSTVNPGVLDVTGTSVGAGGEVCSFFSDRWMEIH